MQLMGFLVSALSSAASAMLKSPVCLVTQCFGPVEEEGCGLFGFLIYLDPFGLVIVVAISLMFMYSIAVIVERLMAYRAVVRESRKAAREIDNAVRFGRLEEAMGASARYPISHNAALFDAALKEIHPLEAITANTIERAHLAIESAIAQQTLKLGTGLRALIRIACVAPLAGLWVTLIHLPDTYYPSGIYEMCFSIQKLRIALYWFESGLFVSAFSLWWWFSLSGRITGFVFEMNEYSRKLIDWMLRQQLPAMQPGMTATSHSQSRVTRPIG